MPITFLLLIHSWYYLVRPNIVISHLFNRCAILLIFFFYFYSTIDIMKASRQEEIFINNTTLMFLCPGFKVLVSSGIGSCHQILINKQWPLIICQLWDARTNISWDAASHETDHFVLWVVHYIIVDFQTEFSNILRILYHSPYHLPLCTHPTLPTWPFSSVFSFHLFLF